MERGARRGISPKVHLVRYADDFVITGRTKELLECEVLPLVKNFLAERGLELSREKTRLTHISEGFDFLGQNIRKYNGKLLIKPSKKSVKRLLSKIREVIKANKSAKPADLIAYLSQFRNEILSFGFLKSESGKHFEDESLAKIKLLSDLFEEIL